MLDDFFLGLKIGVVLLMAAVTTYVFAVDSGYNPFHPKCVVRMSDDLQVISISDACLQAAARR